MSSGLMSVPDERPAHLLCRCGAQLATNLAPVKTADGTLHTSDSCLSQGDRIEAMLESLMVAHNDMVTKVDAVITQVAPHLDTIGPMLDNIANHPMMRMFTGGTDVGKKSKRGGIGDQYEGSQIP